MFLEICHESTETAHYVQHNLYSSFPQHVHNMESKLDKLTKYVRVNYKTQEEFAKAVGLTRSGLRYIINQAKINKGDLPQDFLLRLEHRKINIFKGYVTEDDTPSNMVKEPEREDWQVEVIRTQRELIDSLKEQVEQLKVQLSMYAIDVGKAGARRTSV